MFTQNQNKVKFKLNNILNTTLQKYIVLKQKIQNNCNNNNYKDPDSTDPDLNRNGLFIEDK